MDAREDVSRYLPLTEGAYYILLALTEPLHGYAVMQRVEALSEGVVAMGPGTLYGAFAALEKAGLIAKDHEEERRKVYALTAKGRRALEAQMERIEIMARSGAAVLGRNAAPRSTIGA